MKKFFLSTAGGLIFGLLLSFTFMDYESSWMHHTQRAGVDQMVKEMDFDFVFFATILVLVISILIFAVWTFIEKKNDASFIRDFENDKKRDN
ncbi:hypothetical protein BBI11_13220 [Planococcus maritimus]|uniref:hypothetical protein n=1 Tax=Planococcus maritimus TaxID=192421 RepID=UPI00080F2309|nr:hypothetical protein [Planococcus maritimus]ANU17935.1 hypothetical protein BBI11_13220 [Planococcus maritimus]